MLINRISLKLICGRLYTYACICVCSPVLFADGSIFIARVGKKSNVFVMGFIYLFLQSQVLSREVVR